MITKNQKMSLEIPMVEEVFPVEDMEVIEFLNVLARITVRIMADRRIKEYTGTEERVRE